MTELEELKKQVEELNKKIEELENRKNKRWRAKENNIYYYVDNYGEVAEECDTRTRNR